MADARAHSGPLVSLVLPILNEAAHLDRSLGAIDRQSYPRDLIEILAVDGGSNDGTLEMLRARMASDRRVRLLGGPGVNTPQAMRIGAAAASGEIIVKVDGHGWMNDHFVEVAVDRLLADPRLGCVGGVIEPIATTAAQRANAIARFSWLGVGGGVYTRGKHVQETDTVQCGAYRRAALDDAGGFDPALAYGEDEELNFRVRRAGWRILLDPAMRFMYQVRPDAFALFRQYFRYGRARVAVIRRHPSFFRLKHALPGLVVACLIASVPLAISSWRNVTLTFWGGYAALLLGGGSALAIRHRFSRPDLVAASLAALHLGYGLGTLRGLLDRPRALAERAPQGIE